MKTVFDLTNEELKTYIGSIMSDLRSTWIDVKSYKDRLEVLQGLLELLIEKEGLDEDDLNDYRHDLEVVDRVLNETDEGEEPDGRVFRDECCLYEYASKDGVTNDVKAYVDCFLDLPQYSSFYTKGLPLISSDK